VTITEAGLPEDPYRAYLASDEEERRTSARVGGVAAGWQMSTTNSRETDALPVNLESAAFPIARRARGPAPRVLFLTIGAW
jgi:hypothetical protein